MNKKTKTIILIALVILLLILVGLCIYLGAAGDAAEPTESTETQSEATVEATENETEAPVEADNVAIRTEPQEVFGESTEAPEETSVPASTTNTPDTNQGEQRPVTTNPPETTPPVTTPPATNPPTAEPDATDAPSADPGSNQTPPAIRG